MVHDLALQLDRYFDPFLKGPAHHMKTGVQIDTDILILLTFAYSVRKPLQNWLMMIDHERYVSVKALVD